MKHHILLICLLAGGCHAVPAAPLPLPATAEECVERAGLHKTCRYITEDEKRRILEERGVANQTVEAPYIGGGYE